MYDKCYFCLDQLPKLKKESIASFFVNFGGAGVQKSRPTLLYHHLHHQQAQNRHRHQVQNHLLVLLNLLLDLLVLLSRSLVVLLPLLVALDPAAPHCLERRLQKINNIFDKHNLAKRK